MKKNIDKHLDRYNAFKRKAKEVKSGTNNKIIKNVCDEIVKDELKKLKDLGDKH